MKKFNVNEMGAKITSGGVRFRRNAKAEQPRALVVSRKPEPNRLWASFRTELNILSANDPAFVLDLNRHRLTLIATVGNDQLHSE